MKIGNHKAIDNALHSATKKETILEFSSMKYSIDTKKAVGNNNKRKKKKKKT